MTNKKFKINNYSFPVEDIESTDGVSHKDKYYLIIRFKNSQGQLILTITKKEYNKIIKKSLTN